MVTSNKSPDIVNETAKLNHDEYLIYNSDNIINSINTNTNVSIKDFYRNASIFVTGGTGFLGKVLIEKLLRSCEEIKSIYILLRPKRNLSSEERYKDYVKNSVFDRIRSKNPATLDKLVCVSGDITESCIGLNDLDYKNLQNSIDIVFHVAATIKFNEELKYAANLNTIGTQRILDLCSTMKNLKSIVHVSTAYSNPGRYNVDEVVYPSSPAFDRDSFLKCVNVLPNDVLNLIADGVKGSHPNTYTFTKLLAEQMVSDYSHNLPICIVRPSIVTAAIEEPFPGWIDNTNGVTGIMIEISRGTLQSVICNQTCVIDIIPVDTTVNTLIAASWMNSFKKAKKLKVYNCTSGQLNPITWVKYGTKIEKYAIKNPTKYVMLYPGFSYHQNRFIHKIKLYLLHYFPAYVFDMILKTQGAKPIMMKIAKRLEMAMNAGEFFANHEWNFETSNLRELIKNVQIACDGNEFNCDISEMNWDVYLESYMFGIRKFILKDSLDSMDFARKKINRLYWTTKIFQLGFICLFCKYILKFIHFKYVKSK